MHRRHRDAELFLCQAGAQNKSRSRDDQIPGVLVVRDEIVDLPYEGQHQAPRH